MNINVQTVNCGLSSGRALMIRQQLFALHAMGLLSAFFFQFLFCLKDPGFTSLILGKREKEGLVLRRKGREINKRGKKL